MTPKDHDNFIDDDFSEDEFLDFDDSEDDFEEHLLTADYDDAELERRRAAYADLKKNDKIFNNSYNFGYDVTEDDADQQPKSAGSGIKLDSGSPDYHLYDPDQYSDHVDLSIIQRDIHEFIQVNVEIQKILGSEPDKKKFVKSEINSIFEILNSGLSNGTSTNVFINPIHILDSMSSILNMEYKKIFDQLSYDNKEILLVELNNKYGFLDSMGKNYKIF